MDSLADLMGGLSTEIPNSTSDPIQSLSASGMNTQQSMRVPATSLGNQSGLSHGSSLPTLGNQARPLDIPPPQGGGSVPQPLIVKLSILIHLLIRKLTIKFFGS
jgi:hypothetical protein